jgi:hypothetical protein
VIIKLLLILLMDSKNVQINTEVGFVALETEVAQDTGFVGQRIVVEEGRPTPLARSAWTVEEIVGRIWPLAHGGRAAHRKGRGSKFPHLDKVAGGNASEPRDAGVGPGKSCLFFASSEGGGRIHQFLWRRSRAVSNAKRD